MTAKHLRLWVDRCVNLIAPDVDPHINDARLHIRVPGETHADDVKQRRQALIGNGNIRVFKTGNIGEVFSGSVESRHAVLPVGPLKRSDFC